MQDPVTNLLGTALVPELGADVAAGTAGHIHLTLVGVAALGALPDQLAIFLSNLDLTVPAADLAIVALGVQLGVDDVVVDELHYFQNGGDIVLHVGDFHVADGAAGGEVLELGFEFQLVKGVDILCHMDMVGVRDIALVGDAVDDAEAVLQALGELIGGGLQGRAVEGVVDVLSLLPLLALVVHFLHHGEGEGCGGGVRVALAGHILHALIEPGVAERDGGVAVVQQLVDGLALLQTGQGAVLPQDGGHVGQRALQPLVAAPQGTVAQLQPLLKDLPELVQVAAGGEGHVR